MKLSVIKLISALSALDCIIVIIYLFISFLWNGGQTKRVCTATVDTRFVRTLDALPTFGDGEVDERRGWAIAQPLLSSRSEDTGGP